MAFKKEYSNKVVGVKGSSLNVRELPSTNSKSLLLLKAGQTAGRSSGQVSAMSDGEWLQVNLYSPVNGKKYGYVRRDVVNIVNPLPNTSNEANSNAPAMVADMLKNDKQTLANLNKIFILIGKLKKSGVDVSKIEPEFKKYLDRLMQRQLHLLQAEANGLITITKAINSGIKVSNEYHQKYGLNNLTMKTIGIAPVVLIVGGVVIGGVAAAALYYLIKPDYEDSKLDFIVTDNLQKEIDKYIPKEKQAEFKNVLQKESQPQLNDAFNAGKTDQKWGDVFSVLKYMAIFGGGFFIVDRFIVSQSNKRKAAR